MSSGLKLCGQNVSIVLPNFLDGCTPVMLTCCFSASWCVHIYCGIVMVDTTGS